MILKNLMNKSLLMAVVLSFLCREITAMKAPSSSSRSPNSQLARSASPTQLQLYLPSRQMEPHRAVSEQNIKKLYSSLEDSNEGKLRLNLRNSQGLSGLEFAILTGYYDGIQAFMKKGASPAITNEETVQNGFHIAAAYGTAEIVRFLMVRTRFPEIQACLQKAREEVVTAPDDQRGALLLPLSQELTKKHLVQLRWLVTQADKIQQTPEQLALKNSTLTPNLINSAMLEEVYGQDITDRYMNELVVSVTRTIAK